MLRLAQPYRQAIEVRTGRDPVWARGLQRIRNSARPPGRIVENFLVRQGGSSSARQTFHILPMTTWETRNRPVHILKSMLSMR